MLVYTNHSHQPNFFYL